MARLKYWDEVAQAWKYADKANTSGTKADLSDYATKEYVDNAVNGMDIDSAILSPYQGKTANFMGDSITALIPINTDKPYHSWVADLLGMRVNNYGISGTSLAANNEWASKAMHIRYADMEAADIVVIAGGVNDAWHGSTLGSFGDTQGNTVYGALDILCRGLRKKYPLADIIFFTPTEHDRTLGFTMYECAEAIKKVCNKYAIHVYDNRLLSGFYPQEVENKSKYTTDGLHWNSAAHEKVGKAFANYLLQLKGYPSCEQIKVTEHFNDIRLLYLDVTYGGGAVEAGTSVSELANNLVVKAVTNDGNMVKTTDYSLSGTINTGNNTITVSHGGKTARFTVTGIAKTEHNGLAVEEFKDYRNGLESATWYRGAGAYHLGELKWAGTYDHTAYIKFEAGTYVIHPSILISACIFNTNFEYESTIQVDAAGADKEFTLDSDKYLIINHNPNGGAQTYIWKK